MSIMVEEEIYSVTQSLFSGRVFPDIAPPNTVRPFMTYQSVGGVPSNTLCGNTTQQNSRIQFNVWCDGSAGGRTAANTLMRAVEVLVTEAPLRGVSLGSLVALYDEITKTYGARQEFSFWHPL